jgi:hypothetical protein
MTREWRALRAGAALSALLLCLLACSPTATPADDAGAPSRLVDDASQPVDGGSPPRAADAGTGGDAATFVPADLPDDEAPYDLIESCDEAPRWNTEHLGVQAIWAPGPDEVWLVDEGDRLFHYHGDGAAEPVVLEGVRHVWGCGADQVWIAGGSGRLHRWDGDAFTEIRLETEGDLTHGAGCGAELWVSAMRHAPRDGEGAGLVDLFRFDGSRWSRDPLDLTGTPFPELRPPVIGESVSVVAVGRWRVLLERYGALYVLEPDGRWRYRALTDDLNTDLFLRHEGTGFTLHYGYALVADVTRDREHTVVEELRSARRVARRSDRDAWFVGGDRAVWYDGSAFHERELPSGFQARAVHASSRAIWIAGYPGLLLRSQTGWCRVGG